eukprot:TRINITY_DN6003_c0_g1_i1.p1 TRINITY_DN6003_c0_g1~~TRINITY_DN6003_c0_g1_i1.p1  ORF type:complete len:307 (-),score=39.96 TRINITY_DN6003_c0_g1_i1:10-834(-)
MTCFFLLISLVVACLIEMWGLIISLGESPLFVTIFSIRYEFNSRIPSSILSMLLWFYKVMFLFVAPALMAYVTNTVTRYHKIDLDLFAMAVDTWVEKFRENNCASMEKNGEESDAREAEITQGMNELFEKYMWINKKVEASSLLFKWWLAAHLACFLFTILGILIGAFIELTSGTTLQSFISLILYMCLLTILVIPISSFVSLTMYNERLLIHIINYFDEPNDNLVMALYVLKDHIATTNLAIRLFGVRVTTEVLRASSTLSALAFVINFLFGR